VEHLECYKDVIYTLALFPCLFLYNNHFFFILKYDLCPSSIVCSTNPTNYIGKYIPISKNIIKGSLWKHNFSHRSDDAIDFPLHFADA